ncbi:sulfur carrier protein ThiS [Dyadobacter sp. CY343]|uniref:sulfur carrier protein ThiS n=1 Tax=Dyadobacter sp. CY343 TaxID=2907299 RepID=UPI001F3BA6D0|nr:sulfur carrier protein ThiS [Dyadobacter sp. CY343]MCE7060326.1 sulfur carrier protein ThiS [Dyadobacter sp. CY343]
MEITVNDQSREIPEAYSVQQLLSGLFPDTSKGIAVAINQSVLARSEWERHLLQPNDRITLIKATQGG